MEVVDEPEVGGLVDLVGGDDDRQAAAAQDVGDLLVAGAHPARASTTSSATWASASASRAWSWIETDSGSSWSRSTPPVSISVKRRPFQSVASSLRSRVMPGRSWTTASRDCVRRLTSEDCRRWGSRRRRLHRELRPRRRAARSARRPRRASGRSCRREPRRRPARARCGRRLASRRSRSAGLAQDVLESPPVWAARRRARSSGEAVRKTFTAASGATTEPMSRPSATQSPSRTISCCRRTSASRTPGSAATREAPARHVGGADRVGDVAAVEQDAVAERIVDPPRSPRRRRRGRGGERHRAVHRPRVQVREAEPLRDGAGDGGLAGPRGAVDGDDHGDEARWSLARHLAARRMPVRLLWLTVLAVLAVWRVRPGAGARSLRRRRDRVLDGAPADLRHPLPDPVERGFEEYACLGGG